MTNEETKPAQSECHTLYIGNLDEVVTEQLLMHLFNSIATVRHCKIMNEGSGDIYGFIEFEHRRAAQHALDTMNGRILEGKPMKINWASSSNSAKVDTSKHHHVFVGDLCPDLDNETLWKAFQKFGNVSDCKIIRDSVSLKSKGYGFVSFVNREEAECAIVAMNGVQLGSKVVRTNWASRRNVTANSAAAEAAQQANALSYSEVYKMASETNTTVYCGGITSNTTVNDLQTIFSEHGHVVDVKIFGEKGYAFIKFSQKDSAARAIVKLNGTKFCDRTLKCFWGKESSLPDTAQTKVSSSSTPTTTGPVYQQYYPQTYPQNYPGYSQNYQQSYQQGYPQMAYDSSQQMQYPPYYQMYYQHWMNSGMQQMGMPYQDPQQQQQQQMGYNMTQQQQPVVYNTPVAPQGVYKPQ